MPRRLRHAPAGGVFHITARGNRRQDIFRDDIDRRRFLDFFAASVSQFEWRCHAYCLMDNHVHALVMTPTETLSRGMQWLLGRYAQRFNWRHEVDGHSFQGRFKSSLVESTWHLLEVSRYIVLNPVRAGMRPTAADWPWSSYGAAVGAVPTPAFLSSDWLLSQFGNNPRSAADEYARFVAEAAARPRS
jgi:REP-associated tyrosine transposase